MRDFDQPNAIDILIDEAAGSAPDNYRKSADYVVVLCQGCGTRVAEVHEYELATDGSPLRDSRGSAIGALLIVHERYPVAADERDAQRFPDRALRLAAALERPDLGPLPVHFPVWCHSCRADALLDTAAVSFRRA